MKSKEVLRKMAPLAFGLALSLTPAENTQAAAAQAACLDRRGPCASEDFRQRLEQGDPEAKRDMARYLDRLEKEDKAHNEYLLSQAQPRPEVAAPAADVCATPAMVLPVVGAVASAFTGKRRKK